VTFSAYGKGTCQGPLIAYGEYDTENTGCIRLRDNDGNTYSQKGTCKDGGIEVTVYPNGDCRTGSGTVGDVFEGDSDSCLLAGNDATWIPSGRSEYWECDAADPCFDRELAWACRLRDPDASAQHAFAACFGNEPVSATSANEESPPAERVLMADLIAGDRVLSEEGGMPAITQIIVSQHRASQLQSPMLRFEHALGYVSVTPDHVLRLDGRYVPARRGYVGAALSDETLGNVTVSHIRRGRGYVINPITDNGKILAAAATGKPVVAATANSWLSEVLLSQYPRYSPSWALAKACPHHAQRFYDLVLEKTFEAAVPSLRKWKQLLPATAEVVIIGAGDAVLATSFLMVMMIFVLARLEMVLTVAVLATTLLFRQRKNRLHTVQQRRAFMPEQKKVANDR